MWWCVWSSAEGLLLAPGNFPATTVQQLWVPQTLPKGGKTASVFCQGFAVLQMESTDEKAVINLHLLKGLYYLSVSFCHSIVPCISEIQSFFPIVIISTFGVQNGKMCSMLLLAFCNCLISAFSHLPNAWESPRRLSSNYVNHSSS